MTPEEKKQIHKIVAQIYDAGYDCRDNPNNSKRAGIRKYHLKVFRKLLTETISEQNQ